jgi:hypothetical protein
LDYTWPCRWNSNTLNVLVNLDALRGKPRADEHNVEIVEPNTDALARKHAHDSAEARITPPSSVERGTDQSLFPDPTMAPSVDFQSQDGFQQAAGKKAKKKNAAKTKGEDDEDGSKKDEGEGNKEEDKGDTGAGGSDDKKDETNGDGNGDGDANADDTWGSFLPAKKKKGKKGKLEEPTPEPAAPPADDKPDFFHEIKLDDGPVLDLNFDAGTKSSGGFGAWGSSWNTGTATTTK